MKWPKGNSALHEYIIKVDSLHKKKYLNGEEIYMDNSFNNLENAQSTATIIHEPLNKVKRHKNISIGDKVLIHHFATQESKPIDYDDEGIYFRIGQGFIYMSISPDGGFEAVGPFCIITKEEDSEITTNSGIYTGETKNYEEGKGKVLAVCEEFLDAGGALGDVVLFDKGVDYDITMDNGDVVYRVRATSIYAVVDGE
tara:strand:+ start:499 stop:1092 length:594 start_codon:yes stop_codon:yes gene_type:complete